jgi:NADH-quinone oxidoreductase subunit K
MLIYLVGLVTLFIAKKNNFLLLISIEILYIATNINFVLASIFLDDIYGLMFILFNLAIAGAEVSIGLALFILLYRLRAVTMLDLISNLKG